MRRVRPGTPPSRTEGLAADPRPGPGTGEPRPASREANRVPEPRAGSDVREAGEAGSGERGLRAVSGEREPGGVSGGRGSGAASGDRQSRAGGGVRGVQALRGVRGVRGAGEGRGVVEGVYEESGAVVEPGVDGGAGRTAGAGDRLWHVTLSVSGGEAPLDDVRRGLEQLAHDHPFLLTSRYAGDHAEIRYWEEARDLHDAAAVALRLWGEHRRTARLPPWEIVGLEVIDRETYHQRVAAGYGPAPATPVGVHPF